MEKINKKLEDKKEQEEKIKEVLVRAKEVSISTKHAIAICKFMRHKKIDYSIKFLEEVRTLKKAVPMKGGIPHRKIIGPGRYPVKAAGVFIKLLKNLKSNAALRNVDSSKLIIEAKSDKASRTQKPGRYNRKFKRTHIEIKGILK